MLRYRAIRVHLRAEVGENLRKQFPEPHPVSRQDVGNLYLPS